MQMQDNQKSNTYQMRSNMGDTKSETKNVSGLMDSFIGTETHETTISDGEDSVSNKGSSSEESQEKASQSWIDRDSD